MKVLALGFDEAAMAFLAEGLKAQGHSILGASNASMASSFLSAAPWDVLIVPAGESGLSAKRWAEEKAEGLKVLAVSPDVSGLQHLLAVSDKDSQTEALAGVGLAKAELNVPAPQGVQTIEAAEAELLPREVPYLLDAGDVGALTHEESLSSDASPSDPTRRSRRPTSPESEGRDAHPDLLAKLAQVRFGDYHSILEVEPGGSQYAIREQRERLLHRFSPRGWPARLTPEEIEMLDEIAKGIADAFLILGDVELAARYERALAQGGAQEYNTTDATHARSFESHLLQPPLR